MEIASLEDRVDAETVNGSITFRFNAPGEFNAYLRAKTVNGHISVDFPMTLQNLEKSRHKLEGKLGQGGPNINLETVNGSIRLAK